jgi:hypothetical protein
MGVAMTKQKMSSMMRAIWSVALCCVLSWPVLAPVGAAAQGTPVVLKNDKIEFKYEPPAKPALKAIYERLRKRQFLEQLKEFLSPLRLPVPLKITALECGVTNSFWWDRLHGLQLCYEWPDWVERLAPAVRTPEGFSREDVITGAFLQVTLHELGHGLFDIYDVPIFGREEDAADQIAGFIMTQFGKDVARRLLPGTAYFWKSTYLHPWPHELYSDEHGNPLQRSYNNLCIAYGGDKAAFQDIVQSGLLPAARAATCEHEFLQIRNAFAKTIFPHIDPVLMHEVQRRQWLRPEDGR